MQFGKGRSKVLLARLNIENGLISRILFDWPAINKNKIFKSHFSFDCAGRIRLLNVEVKSESIGFQSTVVYSGYVKK